jgi:IS5 family transposase
MVAMFPGKRAARDKDDALDRIINEIEYPKASVRARVEHPFRVIKLQLASRRHTIVVWRKTPRY